MLSKSRIGTLFDSGHVAFGLITHGRTHGGVDWDRQVGSVAHFISDASHMLTLLRLHAMRVQVSYSPERRSDKVFHFISFVMAVTYSQCLKIVQKSRILRN